MAFSLLLTMAMLLPAGPAKEAAHDVNALVGRWTLDPKRSSDLDPLLDRLEVSSFLRRLAPKTVDVEITRSGDDFVITTKARDTRKEHIRADGVTKLELELSGRPVVATTSVVDGRLVSTGTITLDGEAVPYKSTRYAKADTMHQEIVVGRGGDDEVRVVRVFRRVSQSASSGG